MANTSEIFWVEVLRLVPTQTALSREKLDKVLSWFNPEDMRGFEPLHVVSDEQLNLLLCDGHCRAFAIWATGVDVAPVVIDEGYDAAALRRRLGDPLPVRDISSLPIC